VPLDSVRTARVLFREEFGQSEDRIEIGSDFEMLNSGSENTRGCWWFPTNRRKTDN
jgi:hypothetical protein